MAEFVQDLRLYQGMGAAAPDTARELALNEPDAHRGLLFEKFFGFSPGETNQPIEGPTAHWLNGSAPRQPDTVFRKVGNAAALSEAGERLKSLATIPGHTNVYWHDVALASRLITGLGRPHPSENGFVFHATLGVPYMPGTGLKQVARRAADEIPDEVVGFPTQTSAREAAIAAIFGAEPRGGEGGRAGKVAFLDAGPLGPLTLVAETITAHYGPYYQETDPASRSGARVEPADWHNPNPVTILAVAAHDENFGGNGRTEARFRLAVRPLGRGSANHARYALALLLKGLEIFGFGAKTGIGYGRRA
jgi:CRISPR-associated protein Cmr6